MNWKTIEENGAPKRKFKGSMFHTCIVWVANPKAINGGIPATCRWNYKEDEWHKSDLHLIWEIGGKTSCMITHYIDDYIFPGQYVSQDPEYTHHFSMKDGKLKEALEDPKWKNHKLEDTYTMDGSPDLWKIAYYPILVDARTGDEYPEPRALVEKPIPGGTDFREIPLRYLDAVEHHIHSVDYAEGGKLTDQ